eukprot:1295095-Amorphochlora_amoeboformis.AAC.1
MLRAREVIMERRGHTSKESRFLSFVTVGSEPNPGESPVLPLSTRFPPDIPGIPNSRFRNHPRMPSGFEGGLG